MRNRYRRLLLVVIVLLWTVGGIAGRALAVTFTEFPVSTPVGIPASFADPAAITTGPDGALWFIEKPNKIGRITTAGVITEFALPERTQCTPPPCGLATSITAGPDGALWFTEFDFAEVGIGRITTDGVITEFPFPGGTSGSTIPLRITTGPDGALWFTELTFNKIGRITTAGAITEFPIPTGIANPVAITTGPDGALWFTAAGHIGRITTDGVITVFPGPVDPVDIITGPDGALWFTESGGKIGRMTTSGWFAEFLIPSGGNPTSITTGPDGAVWFTETGNRIGRITTAGRIDEFVVPTAASGPAGITTGPDGALWFVETATNQIARWGLTTVNSHDYKATARATLPGATPAATQRCG